MKEMKELPYTRQKRILERLNKNDCMTINELAKDFNVSQMTIYRDILQLEKSGDALRVYGGVKAVDKKEQGGEEEALKTSSILRPYCDVTIEERFNKQIDEKRAIARVAASYVKDGDVIAIDPSTTTLHMCSYLQNRKIIVVRPHQRSAAVRVFQVGGCDSVRRDAEKAFAGYRRNLSAGCARASFHQQVLYLIPWIYL